MAQTYSQVVLKEHTIVTNNNNNMYLQIEMTLNKPNTNLQLRRNSFTDINYET